MTKSRIPKLAAAAVILIAILLGLSIFKDSGGVAWAEVLDNVQKVQTYINRMKIASAGGSVQISLTIDGFDWNPGLVAQFGKSSRVNEDLSGALLESQKTKQAPISFTAR